MKLFTIRLLAIAILAFGASAQPDHARAKGKGREGKARQTVDIRFSVADTDRVWEFYRANPNLLPPGAASLPPGLAKKVQRGKPLPPGWQRKIGAFPPALDARLGPLPAGYRRVIVDRWAFVIANATNVVLDVIDLIRG